MAAEHAPLAPHSLEGLPTTPDEKNPAKELTTPEHVALEMKQSPKSLRAFIPWSKKASKRTVESEAEDAKAADTLAPAAPFLSLFR
jgi:ATP-binding cassette subfamily B (MDR/TAP) protein 1